MIGAVHRRRLRQMWRSAGWPCQDMVELELLAAGLLERQRDEGGRETLRVTDAGVQLLAATLQRNRAAFDAHEALVERVVREMQRAGRIVWRGLSLRAPPAVSGVATRSPSGAGVEIDAPSEAGAGLEASEPTPDPGPRVWKLAMPDVFSIRHTTVEDYVEPIVHEVKVRRADLLADLRQESKRAAYLGLSSQCWYVLKAGIGGIDDIPEPCGVMLAHDSGFEVLRAASRRAMRLPLATWMALARAAAEPAPDDNGQGWLGEPAGPEEPD